MIPNIDFGIELYTVYDQTVYHTIFRQQELKPIIINQSTVHIFGAL